MHDPAAPGFARQAEVQIRWVVLVAVAGHRIAHLCPVMQPRRDRSVTTDSTCSAASRRAWQVLPGSARLDAGARPYRTRRSTVATTRITIPAQSGTTRWRTTSHLPKTCPNL